MWFALAGTALGWATSVIVLVWQLGRVRRELASSRGQVQQLEVDVRRLGEHVEHQVQLINGLHELWREDRSRLIGALEVARAANAQAVEALREVLSDPSVPPRVVAERVAGVLSHGAREAVAVAGASSDPVAAMPPVTRPPARGTGGRGI